MKLRLIIITIICVFALPLFLMPEENQPPKQILQNGDVENFIKTFPSLKKDLNKFDVKYEAKQGNVNFPDALQANQEFMNILGKYGWTETFFLKAATIFVGYSYVVYGKEISKAAPEIEAAIKEIESNKELSKEMKDQIIKQLLASKGIMQTQDQEMKKNIHPNDLELIRPLADQLKTILE